jgi:hypothetical protein
MSGRAMDANHAEITPKRQKSAVSVSNGSLSSEDDQKRFDDLFAILVSDLHSLSNEHGEVSDALQWFKRVCCLVMNVALLIVNLESFSVSLKFCDRIYFDRELSNCLGPH